MTGKMGLDLKSFGNLAKDWSDWRDVAADIPLSVPGSDLLRAVTDERRMWELLLSSMAHVLVGPQARREGYIPEIGMQERLIEFTQQLSASVLAPPPPGFEEVASEVATIPYEELLQEAPRLAGVLEATTHAALSGALLHLYCKNKYPNGGADYRRCLIGGA